jgi:predicted GNAT superfamily acetyltransferase
LIAEVWQVGPRELASPVGSAMLALNNAHARELSWLAPARLAHLVTQAFRAGATGQVDAFLLAFDEGADYDSPNFLWFRDRFERFVYVDRIVVAPAARGRGLARLLYEDLFSAALSAGHAKVGCEVNSRPPNPGSDAMHDKLGFAQVGEASVANGEKTVRYLMRTLA